MILSFVLAASLAVTPQESRAIDELARKVMHDQHLPGLSLAVALNGRTLYARGYGERNVAREEPAGARTIYNIGSVTKQFTAAAILLLQQEGKLHVDDRLPRYFPHYAQASRMTLRNLLNHTSGIPDYVDVPDLPHRATAMRFFRFVEDEPLDFKPGTRFEYSNTNYLLLGKIVEKVSGESYGDFVSRYFFQPLGMRSSYTRIVPRALARGAMGYTYDGGSVVDQPATVDDIGYGDGTIDSSALDLVRWDAALDGGRVVDAASWTEMTTPPKADYEPAGGYGFGLQVGTIYGRRTIEHSGDNPGFITLNATVPSEGFEIAILANSDNFSPDWLFHRIYALLERPTRAQIALQNAPVAGEDPAITALAREWLHRLQTGQIDATALAPSFARQLTHAAAREMAGDLSRFGKPRAFVYEGMEYRARVFGYSYEVRFDDAIFSLDVVLNVSGQIVGLGLDRED